MPTECERSVTSPSGGSGLATTVGGVASSALIASEIQSSHLNEEGALLTQQTVMEGDMSTSQTSTTSNASSCNGGRKSSITSPDPTAYVAKARVTRPTPPPPPHNPMQFVQIKPCNLYQTAQEQLKKAEEVKKIKEVRKEEPEDWQNNLDNWKSSRRKRVEHIIDRVVEVKKLELEEHDRTRRKSKTFSEMIEDRVDRVGRPALKKLASLAVYNEDESNDLSDLGIGTSSASGKSSLSEDYDNNSVMSDNAAELDKAISNSNHKPPTDSSTTREYISSPGYETSSSTAPASSPDPCEYTYEGAIQDYKQRVSRAAAASGQTSQALNKLNSSINNSSSSTTTTSTTIQHQQHNCKESTPERPPKETSYPPRRGSKIEDRLIGFEVQSPSEECVGEKNKVDVPKVDISKRKEIFESQSSVNETKSQLPPAVHNSSTNSGVPRVALRDRFKPTQETPETVELGAKKDVKRLSGDITSIKERLQNLEQQQNLVNGANGANKTTANKLVDIPVPPLKERLSSLQNAVTKEDVRKPPVALVDARQLEIMKSEEEKARQTIKEEVTINTTTIITTTTTNQTITKNEEGEVDRDDSGIHTADDIDVAEERLHTEHNKKEQELKLNAAIEALAMEEKQFAEAANAVNQIEAEFEELTLGSVTLPPLASTTNNNSTTTTTATAPAAAAATSITNDHMEYSVSSTNQHPNCLKLPTTTTTQLPCSTTTISSSDSSNCSLLQNYTEVKGIAPTTGSNLRRKPTNEMVHAKNLLRIFNDTFQNDIELDEADDNRLVEHETKAIPHNQAPKEKLKPFNASIKTEIFEISSPKSSSPTLSSQPASVQVKTNPLSPILSRPPQHPPTQASPTLIPRCVTPSGKPPMSPITVRSTTKFRDETPPGSPSATRKHDSQFSINGRVEIFNSKNMSTNGGDNIAKAPPSPTITTKITYLPHITNAAATTPTPPTAVTTTFLSGAATPKSSTPNNIVLQQQQQQAVAATTAWQSKNQTATSTTTTTVIEPLLSNTDEASATTIAEKKSLFEMKSMPSRQMVNEPQITRKPKTTATVTTATLDRETRNTNHPHSSPHHHQQHGAVKQQQPQQQQTTQQSEVVVCAPPITIVDPDELPKPNTVKNLSSVFQQHVSPAATIAGGGKLILPKPLPRSRIPQATPPQSPNAVKRNVASHAEIVASAPPPTVASVLDDEKKLSMISNSSSSSNSTVCTVIDQAANKKLSVMSNASTISSDSSIIPPTIVKINAQIHREPPERTPVDSKSFKNEKDLKSAGASKPTPDASDTKSLEDVDFKPIVKDFLKSEIIFSESCETKPESPKSVDFVKTPQMESKTSTTKTVGKVISPTPLKEVKSVELPKQTSKDSKSPGVSTETPTTNDPQSPEDIDFKPIVKDFLKAEIIFSESCETKPKSPKSVDFVKTPQTEFITSSTKTAGQMISPSALKAAKSVESKSPVVLQQSGKDLKSFVVSTETSTTSDAQSPEDVDYKPIVKDFLKSEMIFSDNCEFKPNAQNSLDYVKEPSTESKSMASKTVREVISPSHLKEMKSVEITKQTSKDTKSPVVLQQSGENLKSPGVSTETPTTSDPQSSEDVDYKPIVKDFLKSEIVFSETCETKPNAPKSKDVVKQPSSETMSMASIAVTSTKTEKEVKSVELPKQNSKDPKSATTVVSKPTEKVGKSTEVSNQTPNANDSQTPEDIDFKPIVKDFLTSEIIFSETCETKPISSTAVFESKLQPLKVAFRHTGDVRGNVTTPTGSAQVIYSQTSKDTKMPSTPPLTATTTPTAHPRTRVPLKIDISQGNTQSPTTTPRTPLSPGSQLFRTTKPLVVSTLYDKYLPEEVKAPTSQKPPQVSSAKTVDLLPPSNMRPTPPSPKTEVKSTTPTIVIPAELPHLVDCPPNDSTLYKLASSAPHSPVSTSPNPDHSMAVDSALCSSLLTSMAAAPDFVNFNRQTTVEESICQKIDVAALPIDDPSPATGFADISKTDIKHSGGIETKLVYKMHDAPANPLQKPVEEEFCQKIDARDLPDEWHEPKTDFKAISPMEIRKCDNLFGGKPQSPIMEARAAHSKALIETCEKIIAEEKQANNQLKSTLPSSPKATPILQKKSKIPKPLPSCCLATESMNEADLKERPTTELRSPSQSSSPKDDAVIARMHVVETQIKVTTTTPPTSPKAAAIKPQPSPQLGKKTKNIFDFIKKNFGVGGNPKEEVEQVDSKYKQTTEEPTPSAVAEGSDNKVVVLNPKDVQTLNTVKFDEIHNVDNSKFYLPSDDVAPPPLPKTPAPVNIEITRKIITDEIVEDGKTELEFTSEIDALLDVELNKLNHEIEELDKAVELTK